MGSTTIAVDTLDRLAVQLAGIQEAAKQLREIGSFQDAIADLTVRRDALLAEVDAAKARHTTVMTEHLQALDQVKRDRNALTKEAQSIVATAKETAAKIVAEATEQAALDLQADRVNRQQIIADLQKTVESEQKRLAELVGKSAHAKKAAEIAEQRVVAAQAALEKIQAQARALVGVS